MFANFDHHPYSSYSLNLFLVFLLTFNPTLFHDMSNKWNKNRYHSPLNDAIALLLSEIQAFVQTLTDWSLGKVTAANVQDAQIRMVQTYTKYISDLEKHDIGTQYV